MEWYLVTCTPGKEEECKSRIEQRIRFSGTDDIPQVIIPTQEEVSLRGGQRISSVKKIFPGYLMVEMEMSPTNFRIVRETPGVRGFTSTGKVPTPMTKQDVNNALSRMDTPRIITPKLKKGDIVKIEAGPFKGILATVDTYLERTGRLKVDLQMLGRETKTEIDVGDIQKQ